VCYDNSEMLAKERQAIQNLFIEEMLKMKGKLELEEDVLDDDYPVHVGFYYVADGEVIRSEISGDVLALKFSLGALEIRRCNMAARNLSHYYKCGKR